MKRFFWRITAGCDDPGNWEHWSVWRKLTLLIVMCWLAGILVWWVVNLYWAIKLIW